MKVIGAVLVILLSFAIALMGWSEGYRGEVLYYAVGLPLSYMSLTVLAEQKLAGKTSK